MPLPVQLTDEDVFENFHLPAGSDNRVALAAAQASARPGEVTMDGRSEAGDGAPNAEDLRSVPGARYVEVPIDAIRANPRQPRSAFDEDELAELADSIRGVGLLQPVVVRPLVGEELRQADDAGAIHAETLGLLAREFQVLIGRAEELAIRAHGIVVVGHGRLLSV